MKPSSSSSLRLALCLCLVFLCFPGLLTASTFTSYSFIPYPQGANPESRLLLASDGIYYGTTTYGGASNNGTIYRMTPAGTLTTLVSFNSANGSLPAAGLIQGSDGNFYGTTVNGGSSVSAGFAGWGTVFKMSPAGVLTTLVNFGASNGDQPEGALLQGSDGNFYGTTFAGGTSSCGTVFQMTPAGVLTTLVNFSSTNGAGYFPAAGLIQGTDGNLYGTTSAGGSSNGGTIFKVTTSGALTTLASFSGNGISPLAPLIQGSDGNFYGTTSGGVTSGDGSIFQYIPGTGLNTLFNFDGGANGAAPEGGLIQGSDGNFYGTASKGGSGGGTIFKVTTGGALTILDSFSSNGATAAPVAGLIQGSDGSFYGTTSAGTTSVGAVFKVTTSGSMTVLATFVNNRGNPEAALVQGKDGNFYGTTTYGGPLKLGTVFQITPEGTMTILHEFNGTDGALPMGALALGKDGNFYGTTWQGGPTFSSDDGPGTVYKITPTGSLTTVVAFASNNTTNPPNGGDLTCGLIQDKDGNFYGTTTTGGPGGGGTVFEVTAGGVLTTLFNFGNRGLQPNSPHGTLFQASDGSLYGTASSGGSGSSNDGVVFRLTSGGTLTTVAAFAGPNGYSPNGLIQGSDGNFYGTTYYGGSTDVNFSLGVGIVFKLTPGGTLTNLVNFNGNNGENPLGGVIQGKDGNFYGTTTYGGPGTTGANSGDGVLYSVSAGGTQNILLNFTGGNGSLPYSAPIEGSDGNFYGTTYSGGSSNLGTVYRYEPSASENVTFASASTVPITTSSYTINGSALKLTLGFAPTSGTVLTVVQNTGTSAISGAFTNLPDGGSITATYRGVPYIFSASYEGGSSGFDLTLTLESAAKVTLSGLATTYTGASQSATATTTPSGLNVTYTYDGSTTAPTAVGKYTVVATIDAPDYHGTATGIMVIAKATAPITLGNLTTTYNGARQSATATTNPAGLDVILTYDRSATAPINAGTYTVVATVDDPNYQGTATGTFVIAKAADSPTLTPDSLSTTYDGKAQPVTLTTTGLPVIYTYNGKKAVPVDAGTYTVVATIDSPDATGTTTGTLTIARATATVTFTPASLAAVYNGRAHAVTATTVPAKLPVKFTYNDSATAPTLAGSYAVVGTIDDLNYTGTADDTLVILPAAPLATTEATTGIGGAIAALSGSINPEGGETSVVFQYGTTTAYGTTTTAQTVPAGTTAVTVPQDISGLSLRTLYHYRVVATNATGTAHGADKTFMTLAPPTIVSAPASISASGLGMQVTSNVTPNGVATLVYFEYGTTVYDSVTPTQSIGAGTTPVNFTEFVTTLPPYTTYYYRVVTFSAAGTFYGPQESYTTPGFYTTLLYATGEAAPDVNNATFNLLGSPAISDGGTVAFLASLTTGGVSNAKDTGIWAQNSTGTLSLVAQNGSPAPGVMNASFSSLGDPLYGYDDGGSLIAFDADLQITTGTTTKDAEPSVWSDANGTLALVALQGGAAPGVTGGTFDTFNSLGLSEAGVVLMATLNPSSSAGITSANDTGIWEGTTQDDLALVFQPGETVGGKTVSKATFASAQSLVGGQTRFFASNTGDLAGGATFSDRTTGIFTVVAATGTTSLVAVSGGPAAGISGATYAAFGSPAINSSDNVAFEATLATSSPAGITAASNAGIWADDDTGTLQLIAQTGPVSGATTTILSLSDPVYNDANQVAFEETSRVTGSRATTTSIRYSTPSDGVETVAQLGAQAPGCPTGATFSAFQALALPEETPWGEDVLDNSNGLGGVILLATLTPNPAAGVTTANNTGIWAVDGGGGLDLIVRTGDVLPVNGVNKTITALLILPSLPQLANQTLSFVPENGDLVYLATFSDGTTAIFNVSFVAFQPLSG